LKRKVFATKTLLILVFKIEMVFKMIGQLFLQLLIVLKTANGLSNLGKIL